MTFKISYNIIEVIILKSYIVVLRESLTNGKPSYDVINKLQKDIFSMDEAELKYISDILKDFISKGNKDKEIIRFYNFVRVESALRKKGS